MSRLTEIKERMELKKHARTLCNAPIKFADQPYSPFRQDEKDIEYLLGEVERLQTEVKRYRNMHEYVKYCVEEAYETNVITRKDIEGNSLDGVQKYLSFIIGRIDAYGEAKRLLTEVESCEWEQTK